MYSKTLIAFEDRLVRIALIGCALPLFLSGGFVLLSDLSIYLKILLVFFLLVSVGFAAFSIRQHVIFQLRTSTNLVEAMTSGDYSLRANNKHVDGALSDFNQLLNQLAGKLAEQSLITREKQILLTKITDQIDVAVVSCDDKHNISLMNPAAETLFKRRFDELEGWPIKHLGLQNIVSDVSFKALKAFEIGQDKRKVYVHTDAYFEFGKKHTLIFISDIQHILRDEERQAWQRLLRVLSHEINNSLAPIASISETLAHIVTKHDDSEGFNPEKLENLNEGLAVISERAHSLNHFIQDYQQLARLPEPNKSMIQVRPFIEGIIALFKGSEFSYPDVDIEVYADAEQLQQVFVNLIKNAEEANASKVQSQGLSLINLHWQQDSELASFTLEDRGKGITNLNNLFIPFYTTKKNGSGIGLSLSRQIAMNHHGDLSLQNIKNQDGIIVGARARLTLPT
ncbi:GHKL domain-containing protein [Glaciecola sp. MH2013]|uniref:sensor histidine kinase n=1 Tax=Glaciecola sp. MH2013 TaxID=2785524 RepID=UPI00189C8FAB|nr:ATP-binding protein [Glaciecola sp. MH2013]MBF7074531.1 GHKL domain-containing protein [Glaciecola sp. MH2013]